MIFTDEQERIIQGGVNHILSNEVDDQVYQFEGKAGTGKSTVLFEMIRRIGIPLNRIATMTYIGQASIVLRTKGIMNAKTIHSWLYEPVEEVVFKNGEPVIDPVYNKPLTRIHFVPKSLDEIDYMIIDEAWTVPKSMKKEIESRGIKIIACGDRHQLPPVNDEPAYLASGKVHSLTNVLRQGRGSNILYLADALSEGRSISPGYYGDVLVIEDKDLNDTMIRNSNIIICAKNGTKDRFNQHVRKDILGINYKLPIRGEKLICRKNQWNIEMNGIALANGLIGSVGKQMEPKDVDLKNKIFSIDFIPDLFTGTFQGIKCDYEYFTSNTEQKQHLKNSPYAQSTAKFDFAYAITTHLSQGAQYPNGIYYKEYFRKDLQANLDYTGITRFSQFVIVVLPTKKFY